MGLKAYAARGMTGRTNRVVVFEAACDRLEMILNDVTPLDPVKEEGVQANRKKLSSTVEKMTTHWKRDKEMIREAHVLFDLTPELKSEGVTHEIGYGRYYRWMPIIRVYRNGTVPPPWSIAFFEDDLIATSLAEACQIANRNWGTWWKRFKWRVAMYRRCRVRAFIDELRGWL